MNIPDEYYQLIITEFDSIDHKIEEAQSIEDKLYFFSAYFGILNRVMNFHFDPTLVFTHEVLQTVHSAISKRMNSPQKAGVISTSVPDILFDSLFKYQKQLIAAYKNKDANLIHNVLEKFSVLTYATSGNGFYLMLNGKLTLE